MSPPGSRIVRVVVTDTNILINLIHIGRLDLLGKLPSYSFVIPEEVVKEVSEPNQANALQTAISSWAVGGGAARGPSGIEGVCGSHPDPGFRRSGVLELGAVPTMAHRL